MPKKLNCWEYMECGRESGGPLSDILSTCPVSMDTKADGINSGKNGGRICWAISGTLCGGDVQGTFAVKYQSCLSCKFYLLVKSEEGEDTYMYNINVRPD